MHRTITSYFDNKEVLIDKNGQLIYTNKFRYTSSNASNDSPSTKLINKYKQHPPQPLESQELLNSQTITEILQDQIEDDDEKTTHTRRITRKLPDPDYLLAKQFELEEQQLSNLPIKRKSTSNDKTLRSTNKQTQSNHTFPAPSKKTKRRINRDSSDVIKTLNLQTETEAQTVQLAHSMISVLNTMQPKQIQNAIDILKQIKPVNQKDIQHSESNSNTLQQTKTFQHHKTTHSAKDYQITNDPTANIQMKIGTYNAGGFGRWRSCNDYTRFTDLEQILKDEQIHILGVQETWMNPGDRAENVLYGFRNAANYQYFWTNRISKESTNQFNQHGGVGIIVDKTILSTKIEIPHTESTTIESVWLLTKKLIIASIYIKPNEVFDDIFFRSAINFINNKYNNLPIIILGDFNQRLAEVSSAGHIRTSHDNKHTLNKSEKLFISTLNDLRFCILNGVYEKANWTFIKHQSRKNKKAISRQLTMPITSNLEQTSSINDTIARHKTQITNQTNKNINKQETHANQTSNIEKNRSVIDLIITNHLELVIKKSLRVLPMLSIDDDHRAVTVKLNIASHIEHYEKTDIWKIKNKRTVYNSELVKQFQQSFAHVMVEVADWHANSIQAQYEQIISRILEQLNTVCQPKLLHTIKHTKTIPAFERFSKKKYKTYWEFRRAIREKVKRIQITSSPKYWRTIKSMAGMSQKINTTRISESEAISNDGICHKGTVQVMSAWQDHFRNIFNASHLNQMNAQTADINNSHVFKFTSNFIHQAALNSTFSTDQLVQAISAANSKGASGKDNIPVLVFKPIIGNQKALNVLLDIFNRMFNQGFVPTQWKSSIIIPIPKTIDNPNKISNWRPIKLLAACQKLFTTMIKNKMADYFRNLNLISDNLYGFRSNRSIHQVLFILNSKFKEIYSNKNHLKEMFILTLDINKAYDCINRQLLMKKIKAYGIDGKLYSIINELNKDTTTRICVNSLESEPVHTTRGLTQGDTLSPFLFNVYTNDLSLTIKANHDSKYKNTNTTFVSHLQYADDFLLIAHSPLQLQSLIDIVLQWAQSSCMTISETKSKLLYVSNYSNQSKQNFFINDKKIEYVEQTKYLGYTIKSSSKDLEDVWSAHFQNNINRTKTKARALNFIARKFLSTEDALKIYKICIMPILLFGCEVLQPTSKIKSQIQIEYNGFHKHLIGCHDRSPNMAFQGELGLWTIQAEIESMQMNFYKTIFQRKDLELIQSILSKDLQNKETFGRALFIHYQLEPVNASSEKIKQTIQKAEAAKWDTKRKDNGVYASKLNLFNKIKQQLCLSGYLKVADGSQEAYYGKQILTKMRSGSNYLSKFTCNSTQTTDLSDPKLQTKKSKKNKYKQRTNFTRTSELVCKLCNTQQKQNEQHILLNCDIFKQLRNQFVSFHWKEFHLDLNNKPVDFQLKYFMAELTKNTTIKKQEQKQYDSIKIFHYDVYNRYMDEKRRLDQVHDEQKRLSKQRQITHDSNPP